MSINLERYKVFYYVCKTGSFSHAAQMMMVSQPALSHSVKKLEEELGTVLFQRQARGVTLTAQGQLLYDHVSHALDVIFSAERKLQRNPGGEYPVFVIGCAEVDPVAFLLPRIRDRLQMDPRLELRFVNAPVAQLQEQVKNGSVDAMITPEPHFEVEELATRQIGQLQYTAVCGIEQGKKLGGHPLNHLELSGQRWVSAPGNEQKILEKYFQDAGLEYQPSFSVSNAGQMLPFIQENMAFGILPRHTAISCCQAGMCLAPELKHPLPSQKLYLVYSKNRHPLLERGNLLAALWNEATA